MASLRRGASAQRAWRFAGGCSPGMKSSESSERNDTRGWSPAIVIALVATPLLLLVGVTLPFIQYDYSEVSVERINAMLGLGGGDLGFAQSALQIVGDSVSESRLMTALIAGALMILTPFVRYLLAVRLYVNARRKARTGAQLVCDARWLVSLTRPDLAILGLGIWSFFTDQLLVRFLTLGFAAYFSSMLCYAFLAFRMLEETKAMDGPVAKLR